MCLRIYEVNRNTQRSDKMRGWGFVFFFEVLIVELAPSQVTGRK